ncbi:MAG: hydrolase [Blastocatellia bacterium AA13]|nr:MAG: hydrolase [Blastocatellia bacterium AA13]
MPLKIPAVIVNLSLASYIDHLRFVQISLEQAMIQIKRLCREKAALVVIDMQEAFRTVIPDFSAVSARIAKAVQGACLLEVPVIVTEQYPRGLKRTAEEIIPHLPKPPKIIEKLCFSSCRVEDFQSELISRNVKQIIVCGIEAHICVTQTVLDLLSQDLDVFLLVDCITSRKPESKEVALARLTQAGAIPSNLEMALFEMMKTAESAQFKALQHLIR